MRCVLTLCVVSSCCARTILDMMVSDSPLGRASSSPFSPGFGWTPRSLVGRDDLLFDLGSGLVTGPSDSRYTSLLMGVRGSGKTVALNEIEDRAYADGWVVLTLDASSPGLPQRIMRTIAGAGERYEGLGLPHAASGKSVQRSFGIRLGVLEGNLSTTESYDLHSPTGLREQLTRLAEAAVRQGIGVLLTVDELHGIDRGEARRLAGDLQHITKRAGMPLAFIGAGLLEMKHTLMRDTKLTFFHRCEHYEMPPLTLADATKGLAGPIRGANGRITDEALAKAARSVGSSPYRLQVIGHQAWTAADAPIGVIDRAAADLAAEVAEGIVDNNIGIPAWHDLSDSEQSILEAMAHLGGHATVGSIAARLRITRKHTGNTLRRLNLSGYLERGSQREFRLSELVPERVILNETRFSSGLPRERDSRKPVTPRCRNWMPRAKAYCVLSTGHAGRCRSR